MAELEELARLNRSLSDFTQIVSHDLRAPLRHINALIGFLRDDADEPIPEAMNKRLNDIDERIASMATLISDLLDYARSGISPTATQATDLQTLFVDTTGLVDSRDDVEVSVQADIGSVTTHTVPLSICIRNLVDNAVKYHQGPDGEVSVRASIEGNELLVTVADDGPGIDPDHHERIFQPMLSLGGGTGLGLSTVRKVLDERGGSIALDSEPGRGSAFTITWPLLPLADRPDRSGPRSRLPGPRSPEPRSAR